MESEGLNQEPINNEAPNREELSQELLQEFDDVLKDLDVAALPPVFVNRGTPQMGYEPVPQSKQRAFFRNELVGNPTYTLLMIEKWVAGEYETEDGERESYGFNAETLFLNPTRDKLIRHIEPAYGGEERQEETVTGRTEVLRQVIDLMKNVKEGRPIFEDVDNVSHVVQFVVEDATAFTAVAEDLAS